MKIRFTIFFLLLATVLISYGQTLRMYFLIDDNALIYKLQHLNEPLGFFGAGPIGEGPYRHIVNQFVPFYPLFKVNPTPYFLVGLLLYFATSTVVYWFIKSLTNSKKVAILGSLIFASGYIGSETMFGIVNSWQTCRGVIMALVAFYLYSQFLKKRNLFFYVASLVVFYVSLDTVYIRAHGLIFAIILFDILFAPVKLKIKSILSSIARLTPFAYAHYQIYLTSLSYAKEFGIFTVIKQIISEEKFYLATIPIQDIGNVFIPDRLSSLFEPLFKNYIRFHTSIDFGSLTAGIFVLGIFLYLVFKNMRKEATMTRTLIFAFGWAIANFVMFYAREPLNTLWSSHRYLSYSFAGVAIFWSIAFFMIIKNKTRIKQFIYTMVMSGLFLSFLFYSNKYQSEFNQRRSLPARAFFKTFTSAVPTLKKGDVLYFDIANDSRISAQFGSFFGGMFSEASNFAIYTEGIDYMNDFLFTYKFDEVLSMLSSESLKLDNLYSFYYGQNGLIDNTAATRSLLQKGSKSSIEQMKVNEKEKVVELKAPPNTPSLVPSKLTFSLNVSLKEVLLPFQEKTNFAVTNAEKHTIFNYLLAKTNYYSSVKVSTASFWKEQSPSLMIDGRLDTSWRGHRGYWDEYFRGRGEKEYLIIDLGVKKNISALRWFTVQRPLVPSEYTIFASTDAKNWLKATEIKRVTQLVENSEVIDAFDPIDARYIKIEFSKTFGNDGPEIAEMEVIESAFTSLDKKAVDTIVAHPFGKIDTTQEYNLAADYVKRNSKIKVFWKSDADSNWLPTNYLETFLKIDNISHNYEILLPATGTHWESFRIEGFNFPANIIINSAQITTEKLR